MSGTRPTIVCMTPVKNEAWVLDRFIRCAQRWADHIIIADQGSDDGSAEIARRHDKVRLIRNESASFNEPQRQKLLIDEARKVPGPRVLVALDADEFFNADFIGSDAWERGLTAPPGTVLRYEWACVLPDRRTFYEFPETFAFGYVDDGAPHVGKPIHSPRVPVPEGAPTRDFGIRVLHFSTIDFDRLASKTRWYQTWEYLHKPEWAGRFLDLYRFYHREHHIAASRKRPLPEAWHRGYGPEIDLLNLPRQPYYRWDAEMLKLFEEHGTEKFRRLNLWDVDWNEMHRRVHGSDPRPPIRDPRTVIDKLVFWWLARTQPMYCPEAPPPGFFARKLHPKARRLVQRLGW